MISYNSAVIYVDKTVYIVYCMANAYIPIEINQ